MKKISISIMILMAMSVIAAAQRRGLDNFSFGGVTVISPAKPAAMPTMKPQKSKKNAKNSAKTTIAASTTAKVSSKLPMPKTIQRTASVTDSLAMADVYRSGNAGKKMGSGKSMHGFTTGDPTIDNYIVDSSARYSIDPLLIYAQMHQESSFKLRATSNKGASGLMQLMPATARRFGVTNIYDPRQNIDAGVKYMRWLLDTFGGDTSLALAGYNAGEGAVMKYGNQIPPYNETREYVRRISARYSILRDPNAPRQAAKINQTTVAAIVQKDATPLSLYERAVYAVKMPDGRMRLVSQ
jgi:soluble lytic murein transglycosylase-like protein